MPHTGVAIRGGFEPIQPISALSPPLYRCRYRIVYPLPELHWCLAELLLTGCSLCKRKGQCSEWRAEPESNRQSPAVPAGVLAKAPPAQKAPRPPERGAGAFLCPYPPNWNYSKPEVYQLIRWTLGLTAAVGGCGSSAHGSVNSYSIVVSLPPSFCGLSPLGCRLL